MRSINLRFAYSLTLLSAVNKRNKTVYHETSCNEFHRCNIQ